MRGALDPVRLCMLMLCYAMRTRTGPYVVKHAARPGHAIWPLSRAGSLAVWLEVVEAGAGGGGGRAGCRGRGRTEGRLCCVCVCSAPGRCVSWRLAWRLTNSRDVALSAPCRRPNHHESLTYLVSSLL